MEKFKIVSSCGWTIGGYSIEAVDDMPLQKALHSVTYSFTSRRHVLFKNEAQALFEALRGQKYTHARLQAGIEFLRMVDPSKSNGWSNDRLEQYMVNACETLACPEWGNGLKRCLDKAIQQSRRNTNGVIFRQSFLRAVLLFFATGYQEQDPQRATG